MLYLHLVTVGPTPQPGYTLAGADAGLDSAPQQEASKLSSWVAERPLGPVAVMTGACLLGMVLLATAARLRPVRAPDPGHLQALAIAKQLHRDGGLLDQLGARLLAGRERVAHHQGAAFIDGLARLHACPGWSRARRPAPTGECCRAAVSLASTLDHDGARLETVGGRLLAEDGRSSSGRGTPLSVDATPGALLPRERRVSPLEKP